ncbi:MAG: hypothetical protein LAT63_08140 [Marinobacter sp.]|nr:hypothetical protein [Marinobacter sp.]
MFTRGLVLLCTLVLCAPSLAGEAFRLGLLHGDDQVFDYELSVVKLALAHAPGDHTLEVIPLRGTPQNRIFAMMNDDEAPINLFFSGYSPERDTRMRMVPIPITRGLLGVRLFLARDDRLPELAGLATLEDLRHVTIGTGVGWPENQFMQENGLTLITSQYDNLWRMLAHGRFDLFHRGVQEIFIELEREGRDMFAVVPDIGLLMRYDYFMFVPPQRQDLHDILLTGLKNAYASGAFMENFNNHPAIRLALADAQLSTRRLIPLRADFPSRSLRTIPDHYWHFIGDLTPEN